MEPPAPVPTPPKPTGYPEVNDALLKKIAGEGAWYGGKYYSYASLAAEYKVKRIQEMAQMWKGTAWEKHTIPMLSMLVQECGSLAEVCAGHNDANMAVGMMQNHICNRGFMGVKYCGKGARARFEAAVKDTPYPDFLTNWVTQFKHYTHSIEYLNGQGKTSNQMIMSWNSRETGRLQKVARWNKFVELALGLQ